MNINFRVFRMIGLLVLISLSVYRPANGSALQAPTAWPQLTLEPVTSGLTSPVHVNHAGDERLFIVEQAGYIRIWQGGALLQTPFLDIHTQVRSGGEEGLLSVAFPPDYAAKGYFYVYFTNNDGNNQVARFYTTQDSNLADPNSQEDILLLLHPDYGNHNGGQLAFGPDGYLYIGPGDGGGGGDPFDNAQDPASLLGKILRIDVEMENAIPVLGENNLFLPLAVKSGTQPPEQAYRIPPDNPFAGDPAYRPEIWALGLRNPWRFSFDRQTGDLYIGDVGQGDWEEIDLQPANSPGGENYGWDIFEGNECYGSQDSCNNATGLTFPIHVYSHTETLACSVTGGFVYRGTQEPELAGIYLFADYCNGKIWGLQYDGQTWQHAELLDTELRITSFGEDAAGEVYLVANNGGLYRVTATGSTAP